MTPIDIDAAYAAERDPAETVASGYLSPSPYYDERVVWTREQIDMLDVSQAEEHHDMPYTTMEQAQVVGLLVVVVALIGAAIRVTNNAAQVVIYMLAYVLVLFARRHARA